MRRKDFFSFSFLPPQLGELPARTQGALPTDNLDSERIFLLASICVCIYPLFVVCFFFFPYPWACVLVVICMQAKLPVVTAREQWRVRREEQEIYPPPSFPE